MRLLQRVGHELEQCFRGRIVRQTKTLVEFRVIGLTGSEALGRNTGAFQDSLKALCLCGGVWMLGNVEDEKRGNAFVLGDVIDRGVDPQKGPLVRPNAIALTKLTQLTPLTQLTNSQTPRLARFSALSKRMSAVSAASAASAASAVCCTTTTWARTPGTAASFSLMNGIAS